MKSEIIIKECYHSCPFFRTSMDGMYCSHPYFDDKESWAEMIITQNNSRGKIPMECPLRIEPLQIEYISAWKMEEV